MLFLLFLYFLCMVCVWTLGAIGKEPFWTTATGIEPEMHMSFPMKNHYNSIIPLHLYQTWVTRRLPKHMHRCVRQLQEDNPEFAYHFFDDRQCRQYLGRYFGERHRDIYDRLIPGAYKADFWRYCVLYREGGIYLDIKYQCVNGFRLIALTEQEHFVNDWSPNNYGTTLDYSAGIYNALMVCRPQNPILLNCINQIIHNVQNHYYGQTCLDPTGPYLLSRFFTLQQRKQFHLHHYHRHQIVCIRYDLYKILECYPEYRREQKTFSGKPHYSVLWKQRQIYLF